MPFILIHALASSGAQKKSAITKVTAAVSAAYECSPNIVTTYITEYPNACYGHAGAQGAETDVKRIFVELHALPRTLDQKRRVVKGITEALVECYAAAPKEVIVYIFDLEKCDGAHAGVLMSDSGS